MRIHKRNSACVSDSNYNDSYTVISQKTYKYKYLCESRHTLLTHILLYNIILKNSY